MMDNTLKPEISVLKARVFATLVAGWHLTNCILFFSLVETERSSTQTDFPLALFISLVFSILGTLYFVFNLTFYKWDYSRLGKKRLPSLPKAAPTYQKNSSYGTVGLMNATVPLVSWSVYPEGLKVKMFAAGEGFIELAEMDHLSGGKLVHHSKVVRSPLRMPPAVAEKLDQVLNPEVR